MITVNVRKQGGAAVITIPADVLKILNIGIGSELDINITKKGFTARPTRHKRYTLSELLKGATLENLKALNKATQWARKGETIGRELI